MTPLCVAPDRAAAFWPHVSALIRSAMIRGGLNDFAGIERAVLSGDMLLWIAWDGEAITAAAVTQLSLFEGRKVGTVAAFARKGLDDFAPHLAMLEDHFRAEGCEACRILGRPGWKRMFPDYQTKAIVLEKAL